ncbi:MAG: glycosyl hydrolase family 8 [Bifidobacterium sp.]|uniref:Glucanase n=1 Tax=Bifidobacterium fermentum TaxID=3059035 RepID=A0AB39UK77_9BIFI
MKQYGKRVWIVTVLVTMLYVVTMLLVRSGSPSASQRVMYEQWRSDYIMQESDHRAYVNTSNDRKNPIALSEGQGYGMYLTAAAGAKGWARQQDFDDLLNYYLQYRADAGNGSASETYLMKWRQHSKGGAWISEDSSATDGDLYIAYSLLQASKVWPGRSAYYLKIEGRLAADILTYEYNDTTHTLTVGDWATKQSKYYNLMRTSDVMPSFFAALYESTHDQRWLTVSDSMLDRLVDLSDEHKTGLVPDFAWVTASGATAVQANAIASQQDGDYSSNACRVPMMLALSDDSRARQVVAGLLKFFNGRSAVTAGYSLAGKQLNDYQLNSFTAPLAYAAKQDRRHRYDRLLNDWQKLLVEPLQADKYYDATLTVMAVMGKVD